MAILLTLPGIPAIYYGDEFAATSTWTPGGSDADLRPAMTPDRPPDTGPSGIDLLTITRQLGGFRRTHPWLGHATLDDLRTRSGGLAYRLSDAAGHVLHVYVNPSSSAARWPDARLDGPPRVRCHRSVGRRDSSSRLGRRRLNSAPGPLLSSNRSKKSLPVMSKPETADRGSSEGRHPAGRSEGLTMNNSASTAQPNRTDLDPGPGRGPGHGHDACTPEQRVTRSLLAYGVVAGPFYLAVSLIQAAVRDGFDLSRHEWSLLANGPWGWIQSVNLIVTGLMVVAASVGYRRALRSGPGRRWARGCWRGSVWA